MADMVPILELEAEAAAAPGPAPQEGGREWWEDLPLFPEDDMEVAEIMRPRTPPNTPEREQEQTIQELAERWATHDVWENDDAEKEDVWWPQQQWQPRRPPTPYPDTLERAMLDCDLF